MSWHCDSTELLPGAWLTSLYTGAGVRGADVPSTGTNGPSDLYPTLNLPADNDVEVSGRILTVPSAGTFVRQENGELEFSGAPAGNYSYSFGLYADNVFVGNVTNTITVNAAAQTNVSMALVGDDAVISGAIAAGTTQISLALVGDDAVISGAITTGTAQTNVSMALVGDDAVISGTITAGVTQISIGLVGGDAVISGAIAAGSTQISLALVGDDAVISGTITAGSAQTDVSIALVGDDAVISGALLVGTSTVQVSCNLLAGDAVISASLYVAPYVNTTPGAIITSSSATRHSLRLIIPASQTPVSLAEAKQQLRVDSADDDLLIEQYIFAATELAEQMTGRAIMPQMWALTHDQFPDLFELTRARVLSVVNITYVDVDGLTQTLPASSYALDAADDFGFAYVVPGMGQQWPLAAAQMNSVVLTYQAGYATPADVPRAIKTWVLLKVRSLYDGCAQDAGPGLGSADRLLDSVKVWCL